LRSNQVKHKTVDLGAGMTSKSCYSFSWNINHLIISSFSSITVWFNSEVGFKLNVVNWVTTSHVNLSDPLSCWYLPRERLTTLSALRIRAVLMASLNVNESKNYLVKPSSTSTLYPSKTVVRICKLEISSSITSKIISPHLLKYYTFNINLKLILFD
jgi:hypothetical protein